MVSTESAICLDGKNISYRGLERLVKVIKILESVVDTTASNESFVDGSKVLDLKATSNGQAPEKGDLMSCRCDPYPRRPI